MQAHYISEKFTEESTDPISDLGIGIINVRKEFKTEEEFLPYLYKISPMIINIKDPIEIIYEGDKDWILKPRFFNKIEKYCAKYITINGERGDFGFNPGNFKRYILKKARKKIHEAFREESDPTEDLGIGKVRWFNKVKDFYINQVFGYEEDAELFMEIADDELEEMFQNQIEPDDAADECYSDINLYNKWREMSGIDESLNEKFTDESDPIRDMGIGGVFRKKDFQTKEEILDFLLLYIPSIFKTEEIPDDIVYPKEAHQGAFKYKYWYALTDYCKKYITLRKKEVIFDNLLCIDLWIKLIKMGYPKVEQTEKNHDYGREIIIESLNEKFKEQSDPIHDMGIGWDENTIEGYLKLHGYSKINIDRRKRGHIPAINVEFSKNDVNFEFEIVLDDDWASWRHQLDWWDDNDKNYDCQTERWTLGDKNGEIDDEKFIVSILKRRLNKYNKQHAQT